jgi:hypothetical protein
MMMRFALRTPGLATLVMTLAVCSMAAASQPAARQVPADSDGPLVTGGTSALHRGVYEVALKSDGEINDPYLGSKLTVTFTRPDGSLVTVDGFYDGGRTFKARAYCDAVGQWSWKSASDQAGLDDKSGSFQVVASPLPGKLRRHSDDPRQFAYDDGQWFLHIGDTGYRYVAPTEPRWQAYFDQAVELGVTKIRVWFCQGRHDVQNLLTKDRRGLNLSYWQEIDRRLLYALGRAPHVQMQLIPYGEDGPELNRYGAGDPAAQLIAAHAQARLSALPNVQWTISNDRLMLRDGRQPASPHQVPAAVIDRIGRDMAAREPWGTLLTNHQSRRSGYAFVDSPWSDIITLHDLDQVAGEVILKYRPQAERPVVLDEDRYECYRPPAHPRYFFRRLMWASLLSGGHATYGGLRTYEPYDGKQQGVQGYQDARRAGVLKGGADDFVHIHRFFADAGLALVGMEPNDAMGGNDGLAVKVIAGEKAIIAYLQNADSRTPETANVAETQATCRLSLPPDGWRIRWYDPRTGRWHENPGEGQIGGGGARSFQSPFPGDAVLLLSRL